MSAPRTTHRRRPAPSLPLGLVLLGSACFGWALLGLVAGVLLAVSGAL